jgi:hypothetical protein
MPKTLTQFIHFIKTMPPKLKALTFFTILADFIMFVLLIKNFIDAQMPKMYHPLDQTFLIIELFFWAIAIALIFLLGVTQALYFKNCYDRLLAEEIKKTDITDLLNWLQAKEKEILALEPEWNGPGSTTYQKTTFDRARVFLLRFLADLEKVDLYICRPMLFPGRDGDIDLEWDWGEFNIIISIPPEDQTITGVFGENKTKGTEFLLDFDERLPDTAEYRSLIIWCFQQCQMLIMEQKIHEFQL